MSTSSEGTTAGSDGPPTAVPPRKFWAPNLRLATAWAVIAALAAGFFALRYRTLPGLVCLPAGIYAVYAAIGAVRGLVLNAALLSAPKTILRQIPILTFGRVSVPFDELRDVTSLGAFMTFEVVGLTVVDDQFPVLFASRAQRLAFFEALKAINPEIRIYRTY